MKARYLIYLLSGLMTFYSCVDDKGSYDYLQTPTVKITFSESIYCLLYTSPSPRD